MKILLRIAYDGSNYSGFQRQKKQTTGKEAIQNVLENVLHYFYGNMKTKTPSSFDGLNTDNAYAPTSIANEVSQESHASVVPVNSVVSVRKTLADNIDATRQELGPPLPVSPQPLLTTASGRTDAGVHADDQPVVFTLSDAQANRIAVEKLPRLLSQRLPKGIAVWHAQRVDDSFHPRYDARARLYRYRFHFPLSQRGNPPDIAQSHKLYHKLNRKMLDSYLQMFVGKHDFTTFCSARDTSKNKIRTIYAIETSEQPGQLSIDIYGNAFLRGMVRSIVGNSLRLYLQKKDRKAVSTMRAQKDPRLAKARVPACGLCLKRVFYSPIF